MRVRPRHAVPLACLAMLLAWSGVPAGEIRERGSGASFPREVSFQYAGHNHELLATGTALRRFAIFKVYAMVHYAEAPAGLDRTALLRHVREGDLPLQVTMVFARDIDGDRVGESMLESIRRNTPPEALREAAASIDEFARVVRHDVREGDHFTVRRLPDGTIMCIFNDVVVMVVQDRAFGLALWSVWFGDRPVVDRDRLLGDYGAIRG